VTNTFLKVFFTYNKPRHRSVFCDFFIGLDVYMFLVAAGVERVGWSTPCRRRRQWLDVGRRGAPWQTSLQRRRTYRCWQCLLVRWRQRRTEWLPASTR